MGHETLLDGNLSQDVVMGQKMSLVFNGENFGENVA